jgi:Spy/CpxP family protein refolding chaperone
MTHVLVRLFAAASLAAATFAQAAPARAPAPAPASLSQNARIAQGEQDGSLTAKEARRLRAEQDKIHALERRAESRGGPTAREQRKLEKLREKADEDITNYKHNDHGAYSKSH